MYTCLCVFIVCVKKRRSAKKRRARQSEREREKSEKHRNWPLLALFVNHVNIRVFLRSAFFYIYSIDNTTAITAIVYTTNTNKTLKYECYSTFCIVRAPPLYVRACEKNATDRLRPRALCAMLFFYSIYFVH